MKRFLATAAIAASCCTAAFAAVPKAPAAPILTPDASGATMVSIRALAPTHDVDGNPLTSLTSITIYRDGAMVTGGQEACGWYDQDAVPGQLTTEFFDSAVYGLKPGRHTYYLRAKNLDGTSVDSEQATVFVGIPRPGMPSNAVATETSTHGQVTISWDAPTTDADGNTINPAIVSYTVSDISNPSNPVKLTELTGTTTYTYTAVDPSEPQQIKRYSIRAFTSMGQSRADIETTGIPVGKPLAMPFEESFTGDPHTRWAFVTTGGDGEFDVFNTYFRPFDGDDAVAAFTGGAKGDRAEMHSCQIEIPAGSAPLLSFYFNGIVAGNTNTLELLIDSGKGFEVAKSFDARGGNWQRGYLDMAPYAGRTVRLGFRGAYGNHEGVTVDCVRLVQREAIDCSVVALDIPAEIVQNASTEASVTIVNSGTGTIDLTNVMLLNEDGVMASVPSQYLAPGLEVTIELTIRQGATPSTPLNVWPSLLVDGDTYEADNTLPARKVALKTHDVPAVTDLTATFNEADGTVSLAWSAPAADVTGYYVYNRRLRFNPSLKADATSFVDRSPVKGENSYYVSALYSEERESVPSNIVTVNTDPSGICTPAAVDPSQPRIAPTAGAVEVEGAEATVVTVVTPDGRLAARATIGATGRLTLTLAPGLYIVSAANASTLLRVN